jgi:peptidoglycan/LPS O-acetylase OafA/YrhL
MIAIYLMLPIYKIISANAEPKDLKHLLAVYVVGLSILPFIETISGKKLPFYICVFTIYPLYLFLGHVLHTGVIRLPKNASGLMLLISIGIAIMLTAYAITPNPGAEETIFKIKTLLNVYSFPVYIAAAVGAYGYFRKTKNKAVPVLDTLAAELDNCSFGIYLIHMAVLKYIYAVLKFNPFEHGGTIAVIGVCIVTLAVSYVITRLLKLVPCVKKII